MAVEVCWAGAVAGCVTCKLLVGAGGAFLLMTRCSSEDALIEFGTGRRVSCQTGCVFKSHYKSWVCISHLEAFGIRH